MVSDFLTAAQGCLVYTDTSGNRTLACQIIKYGKNDDGWWDSENMIQQNRRQSLFLRKHFLGILGYSHLTIRPGIHVRLQMRWLPAE